MNRVPLQKTGVSTKNALTPLCLLVPLLLLTLLFAGGCRRSAPPIPKAATAAAAAAAVGPFRFTERGEEAGIAFRLGHQGKSPLTILETAGSGCAFLDYDSDGHLDLFLVGQPRCALYRNRGKGTFEDVTERMGITGRGEFMGVAVSDYDGDGRPDLFLTGYGSNILYHNAGNRFEDVTAGSGLAARGPYDWATSAAFTDLDGDGYLDLAVGHYVTFTTSTPQTCSYSGVQASCPPFYYEPQRLRVFQGDGRGRFKNVTAAWGMGAGGNGNTLGVAAADMDGDGRQDLYVANDGAPADLWQNHGAGKFKNIGQISGTAYNAEGEPQAGMGVDWGDYDNDGRTDLIVTTFQGEPKALYNNLGQGQFRFASSLAGIGNATLSHLAFGVALVDLDGDGWQDLITANGHVQDTVEQFRAPATYRQTLQCFYNRNGVFENVSAASGEAFQRPIVGRGLAVGDYDNDGRADLLIVDIEGRPLLLHNDSAVQNWIGVRLIGSNTNRDAIGAQVTLIAGSKVQKREVQTGRSYLSASDPRILFGLGPDPRLPLTLQVRWPGGRTERFVASEANRYITLREGAGTAEEADSGSSGDSGGARSRRDVP